MIKLFKFTLIALFASVSLNLHAQTLSGSVVDSTGNAPVYLATVAADAKTAAFTDVNGNYKLNLKAGTYTVTIKFLGFKTYTQNITIAEGENKVLNAILVNDSKNLGTVVVTGGQYAKRINEETISIDVVKDYIIKNNASPNLADVVGRTPGVTVIDGQANIRGGSGYAYGVGSRVMLLVDDMPLVRGDWGDLNWNFVPLENADQVEVVKGAASVLYGSSALNGVINVRTAWPMDSVPETKVQVFSGIYFNPKREELRWWKRSQSPNFTGGFFNHKRKIKNVDLVIGGNFNQLNSYMQSNNNQQFRLNTKMRVHTKIPGLTWGVNANIMYNQYDRLIFWENADAGAYKPFGGLSGSGSVTSNEQYYNINIDPNITYITPKNVKHTLRMRYYNVSLLRNEDFDNYNNQIFGEYQFLKRTTKAWVFTAGAAGSIGFTQSTVIGDATAKTYYGGLYAQVEKKLWDRLAIVGGVRYELNIFTPPQKLEGFDTIPVYIPDFSIPVFRLGTNYAIDEFNNIRASWGQGFRSPSVVERFVTGSVGPLNFFSNPALKPESGWNAELAYKRMFNSESFQGYFDFALFWNEYKQMTEFVFDFYLQEEPGGVIKPVPGFKNLNRERSRIAGFEVSGNGEWLINDNQSFRFFGGYTFYYPGDLEGDTTQRNVGVYIRNAFQAFTNPDSLLITKMLTYRMNHSVRIDLEYQIGRFKIGTTGTYNSFLNNIDPVFNAFIPGLYEYRRVNNKGKLIVDARFIYDLKHNNSLGIIMRNMFNTEYSIRPGIMEAPASITFQYSHKF